MEETSEICLAQDREEVKVTPRYLYSVTQEIGEPERRRGGSEVVKEAGLYEMNIILSFRWVRS